MGTSLCIERTSDDDVHVTHYDGLINQPECNAILTLYHSPGQVGMHRFNISERNDVMIGNIGVIMCDTINASNPDGAHRAQWRLLTKHMIIILTHNLTFDICNVLSKIKWFFSQSKLSCILSSYEDWINLNYSTNTVLFYPITEYNNNSQRCNLSKWHYNMSWRCPWWRLWHQLL